DALPFCAGDSRELGDCDGGLVALSCEVVTELLAQRRGELTALLELLDDVGAADELSLDAHLRDRRPAGDRGQLLPDLRIGKDVDRCHGRTGPAKRLERAV